MTGKAASAHRMCFASLRGLLSSMQPLALLRACKDERRKGGLGRRRASAEGGTARLRREEERRKSRRSGGRVGEYRPRRRSGIVRVERVQERADAAVVIVVRIPRSNEGAGSRRLGPRRGPARAHFHLPGVASVLVHPRVDQVQPHREPHQRGEGKQPGCARMDPVSHCSSRFFLRITEYYRNISETRFDCKSFFSKNGRSAGEAPGFQRKRDEGDSGTEGRKIRSRSESAAGDVPVRMGGKVATVRTVTGEQGEHIFRAAARAEPGEEPIMTNAEKGSCGAERAAGHLTCSPKTLDCPRA